VQALAEAGEQVTVVSRKAAGMPSGVRSHQADLAEPESLGPALHGAEALFLLTPPGFHVADSSLEGVVTVVRESGVHRVVLLSSEGVGTGRHSPHLEDAVRASGLEWTILRPGNFDSNAFQWAGSVRAQRIVAAPFGDHARTGRGGHPRYPRRTVPRRAARQPRYRAYPRPPRTFAEWAARNIAAFR
jgi:uncharacterized protein YbjT (DUF2867 family)